MIVGNPPFLGVRGMRASLGDAYVEALFRVYEGRVPHEADLVCYWHEKARAMVEAGSCRRAGLLATQTIRAGANRHVLDRIRETGSIFMAWSDQPWVSEGAAIRVSIVAYDDGTETSRTLNGEQVTTINPDLTSSLDVTGIRTLPDNAGIAFQGMTKGGHFELMPAEVAALLAAPNPDRRSNEDVIKPWVNGMDVARRPRGMFIIDFGVDMPIEEAALYEAPFALVEARVKPEREHNRRAAYRERWWIFDEARPGLRQALRGLRRYIVTPRVTKHRIFAWIPVGTIPDTRLIAFARQDDYFLGVLHARPHEVWSTRTGNEHGVGATLTYIPATTFETFPFPQPTPQQAEEIAAAAERLDILRNGWLGAPSLSATAARDRTLTNLYNEKPAWLRQAHERLDRAVHGAYGWPYPLDDEDVLARLLQLNHERSLSPGDRP
jgi:type II restriction/modification system DNA methylase subunit YeeA